MVYPFSDRFCFNARNCDFCAGVAFAGKQVPAVSASAKLYASASGFLADIIPLNFKLVSGVIAGILYPQSVSFARVVAV